LEVVSRPDRAEIAEDLGVLCVRPLRVQSNRLQQCRATSSSDRSRTV